MNPPLEVLHFIPGLHAQEGGPSRSVVRLTDSLALEDGIAVTLISHSIVGRPSVPSANPLVRRSMSVSNNSGLLKLGLVDRRLLVDALDSQRFDLLHSHGLWHPSNHWAMRLAAVRKIPLICQPRGMLLPWALRQKAWKKRLALMAFHNSDLRMVRLFIATSESEAESIRSFGLLQPVAVIPNGVDDPGADHDGARGGQDPNREKVALFLSRIHSGKGASVLIEAWAKCRAPGWRLVLAGPDEGGHLREVVRHVQRLGVGESVDCVGEVQGEEKAALFRSADLFVLPSFSESFGMVVAEALSYGIPVITTRNTPWGELEKFGCGWWVGTGVEPLIPALREAMSLSSDERHEMGERGKLYASRFQWSSSATLTAEVYRWLLNQGTRPGCMIDS